MIAVRRVAVCLMFLGIPVLGPAGPGGLIFLLMITGVWLLPGILGA